MPSDDKDKFELTKDKAFIAMQDTIKGLALLVKQGQQNQTKFQETMTEKLKSLDTDDPKNKVIGDDDNDDDDAINDLDNKKLVTLVLKEVGKVIDEKVGDLKKNQDTITSRISNTEVEKQINELNKPDILDWADEIKALSKASPNLTVSQLYTLVRQDNPDKAAELDKKYEKEEEKDEKKPEFLSLMPTGGATVNTDEKLTKDEAKDKAWEQTLEEFPELAGMGDG